jgi:hypothetical protein
VKTILTKIREKFTDAFQQATQLVSVLNDGMMAIIASLLDTIESKVALIQLKALEPISKNVESVACIDEVTVTRAFMAVERERKGNRQRARHVIVSGLPPSNTCSDIELLDAVREQDLTVKPHILRVCSLGEDTGGPMSKLCAMLESPAVVDDLI